MALKRFLKRAVTKAASKVKVKRVATNAAKKADLVAKSKRVAKAKADAAAKKARQQASLGQTKPKTKAKTKIKVAPTKRQSTVKSKATLSKTLERRKNRRSSSGKSPATGDKAKISQIKQVQANQTGTSKRRASIKATEQRRLAKVSDGMKKSGGKTSPVKTPKQALADSKKTPSTKKTAPKRIKATVSRPNTVKNKVAIAAKKEAAVRKASKTRTDIDTGRKIATTPGKAVKPVGRARRRGALLKERATKKQQAQYNKNAIRDRGRSSVGRNIDDGSNLPQGPERRRAQAAAAERIRGRSGSEPIDKRKSKRSAQQKAIQERRSNQLEAEGRKQRKGRVQRLSAADARKAADNYEIDKMKEITKKSRTMSGREASDYMKQAKKEMKREAASIRSNARSVSVDKQVKGKNNESPSVAYQEGVKNPIHQRNAQTRGERLSRDMTNKTSGTPVRSRRAIRGGTKSVGQGSNPVRTKAGATSMVSKNGPGVRASNASQKAKDSTSTKTVRSSDRSGPTSSVTRPRDMGTRGTSGANLNGPAKPKKAPTRKASETKQGRTTASRRPMTDAEVAKYGSTRSRNTPLKSEPMYGKPPSASPSRQRAMQGAGKPPKREPKAPQTSQRQAQMTERRNQQRINAHKRKQEQISQGNQEQFKRFNGR